jgi:XTP/dITP diphosphohydrolase
VKNIFPDMIQLVFATHNLHKLEEISNLTGSSILLQSLDDIGCNEDIPETAETLEGNASKKSWYIFNKYRKNCFADDTGLEVEALGGRPGVYSARYAGPENDPEKNIVKLLSELKNQPNRSAQFRTVISLIIEGKEFLFEGIVKGKILSEKHGVKGFGYDPVFQPEGYHKSFAEMSLDEKNKISHRALAIEKLISFLRNLK